MAAIGLHFLLPNDVAVYDSIGLAAAGAILVGVAWHRPATWRAWVTIGASQVLMAAGDLVYNTLTSRSPGPSDVLYLSADALLVSGVVMLAAHSTRRIWSGHLDAVLVTIAVGITSWVLIFDGTIGGGSAASRVLAFAYPLADLLLVGAVVRLLLVSGRRSPSYWLLAAAIVPLFVSDGSWVVPVLEHTYSGGTTLWDVGWLSSYVLVAAAALHPSMGRLVEPHGARERHPLRGVLVLGLALVSTPLAVGAEILLRPDIQLAPVAIAGGLLLGLVIGRFALMLVEIDRLRRAVEASERKFRLVFERAPIGITLGRAGMMGETNPALQRMLGYTAEEFARMHYSEITELDDSELMENARVVGGDRWFSVDKRYRRKDGGMLDTHTHVAIDLGDGFGVSLIEDWSRRRELEEQLRQAQKMEAVGQLAGGVAHDFNNLMTAVLGYSDLILAKLPAEDPQREKIEAIRESAVRASELTRQLLAFGRRQMLRSDDVDLREVVARMDGLLRRLIGEQVHLETRLAPDPVVVRADPTQLEQVVVNLVLNARDAMPGGGTIEVGVRADGDAAVLVVVDDGCGIDESAREHIFEPFFTTKPQGQGSGLGLSTVYGIVGQSGGTIEADSEPGCGTAFTVRLPLAAGGREEVLAGALPGKLLD